MHEIGSKTKRSAEIEIVPPSASPRTPDVGPRCIDEILDLLVEAILADVAGRSYVNSRNVWGTKP